MRLRSSNRYRGVRETVSKLSPVGELDAEQAHLEETWAAYERLLRALRGRTRAGNAWAEEVLDAMRRERLRRYTASSGPLYFGRIDDTGGGGRPLGPPPGGAGGTTR